MRGSHLGRRVFAPFLLCLLLFSLGVADSHAATYYVPDNFSTVQAAIDGSINGDLVLVRPGTYFENINYGGKAITVRSTDGSDYTAINGNGLGATVTFNSAEGSGSVLDGFTVTGGSNSGIYIVNSSPKILNCMVSGNYAPSNGGGMYLQNAPGTITNSVISGNSATNGGGGLYLNSSAAVITSSIINANSAAHGGGIYVYGYSNDANIQDSSVSDNTAQFNGGGVYLYNNAHASFTDCDITGNSSNYGGGVFNYYNGWLRLYNCVIDGNTASSAGGGIRLDYYSFNFVFNCTITGNTANVGGGFWSYSSTGWTDMENTIIYGNSTPPVIASTNSFEAPIYSNNDVEGGLSGNINADPMFVNAPAGDYHLMAGSPCIEAGTSYYGTPYYHDKDGVWRPQGGLPDIGAFEYVYPNEDGDAYTTYNDCNDSDPSIYPGATEIYNNGIDENCNGMADDPDVDLDTFAANVDCNDNDSAIYPGAAEILNDGVDQNCNGMNDEYDWDLDGSLAINDCDDQNPNIYPGAPEIPYNGIDENCNGMADDDDLDHDGYGIADDCNDQLASAHPGALEINYDGIDQDCDGSDGTLGIPLIKIPYTAVTTGIADCDDASIAGNIIAINQEEWSQGVDINNDGDLNDRILGYYDVSTMSFVSTGIDDVYWRFTTDGNYIAYQKGPSKNLAYYSIATGETYDTGLSKVELSNFKGMSNGKIAFSMAVEDLNGDGQISGWPDQKIYVYDVETNTLIDTGIIGDTATISGNIVAFETYDPDVYWWNQVRTLGYYDLSTGAVTDTGITLSNYSDLVIDGNYIVYETPGGEIAYYNLSTGTNTVTPITEFNLFSISRGMISFRANEGADWGDLNGDGDTNDNDMLLLYDIESGQLINTGVRACCGSDISNLVVSIETWESDVQMDLNGDGDMNDCVQQFVVINRDLGPVAVAGGPYVTGPGSGGFTMDLDGSGSFHTAAGSGRTIVEWQWDLDGDGVYEITSPTPVITITSPETGEHTISLRVLDDSQPALSDTATAVIYSTDGPSGPSILDPSADISPYYGDTVTFSSSMGQNIADYAWFDNGNLIASEASFNYSALPVGDHVITLQVMDAFGRWSDPSAPRLVSVLSQATRADLAIEWSDISFWQNGVEVTNPGVDDTVTIQAVVHNLAGDGESSTVIVTFGDLYASNGQFSWLGSASLPPIRGGESAIVSFTWTPANPQPGYHLIQVYVSSDPTETYYGNNSASHHLVRADIQAAGTVKVDVMNLNVSDNQQIYAGERFTLSGYAQYHWQNGYTYPVLGGKVTIRLADQVYEARTDSGGWFYQELVMPLEPGDYPLDIEVSDASISGQMHLTLHVPLAPYTGPDLAAYNIRLANGVAEMPETVSVYVVNRGGDVASGAFDNHIVIVGPTGETVFTNTETYANTNGLCANCGVTIPFTGWTPAIAGNYQITVTTDYNNSIAEDNENNNTATATLYVYPHHVDLAVVNLQQSCKTISALIRNLGGLSSTTGTLHFADAAGDYYEVQIPAIAGKGTSVWVTAAPYSGSQADTLITVSIESSEDAVPDNNSLSMVFDFTDKSDLTVTNLRLNNQYWYGANTGYISMPNTLQAEVRNLGCIDAGGTLEFKVDGLPVAGLVNVPVVQGGGIRYVSAPFDFAGYVAATDYALTGTVTIDPLLTDAAPGNDSRTEALTVSPQLPDYRVVSEDIHFDSDPGHPGRNQNIIISADIHNVGMAEGNDFTVAFYEEGQTLIGEIQTYSINPGIAPGGVLTVNPRDAGGNIVLWSSSFSGNHAIMVVVAPVAGIENDPNDLDNSATRKVWVNYSPHADVVVSGIAGTARPDDTVSFSAAGSTDGMDVGGNGGIMRYDWDFGDGQVAYDAGAEVTHQYLNGGTYTATVTVMDTSGETASASISEAVSYHITAVAGPNGTITPAGDVFVAPGGTQSFSLTPDFEYHILSVDGCGGTLTGSTFQTGTVNADCTVTAAFEINQYDLTVTTVGDGSVASSPAGITCALDSTCVAPFDYGTTVTLTATPAPDSYLMAWSGACTGTGDCTLTVTADTAVTAEFDKYLKTTAPKGNTIWNIGTTQAITWEYVAGAGDYVDIELVDGATVVLTIAQGVSMGSAGEGDYSWTLPAGLTPGTDYAIRVTSTASSAITSTSGGHLTIQ